MDGYNFADVTFDQNGGINCALVNIVPLKQPNAPHPSVSDTEDTAEAPAAMPKQPDPVDPQVWYEVQGRKVLEALITDLHSRGYNSLTIRENGDIAIQQADSRKGRLPLKASRKSPIGQGFARSLSVKVWRQILQMAASCFLGNAGYSHGKE